MPSNDGNGCEFLAASSAAAHESLRRVLAFIRGESKFDPRIKDLVPHLLACFSKDRAPKTESLPTAEQRLLSIATVVDHRRSALKQPEIDAVKQSYSQDSTGFPPIKQRLSTAIHIVVHNLTTSNNLTR